MRLGVLGGSFDPIHNAHLIVAQLAREQLGLDHVHLMVTGNHPFKAGRHHATGDQRAEMAALGAAGIPGLRVDRRELERPGLSYTIDTLQALLAEHARAEITLLLGADAARSFDTWRDPAGIRSIARVAVFRRESLPVPEGFDATVEVPILDISSTAIRARIAAGRAISGWVPATVADYIARQRLYGSST